MTMPDTPAGKKWGDGMRLDIIRGDIFQQPFKLAITDHSVVDSVHLTSAKQNIDVVLAYSDETRAHWLNLSSAQTEALTAGSGKYDVTVVLKNKNCVTMIRNAPFVVWEKVNRLAEVGDVE